MQLHPGEKFDAEAILFDMDGTPVDSTPAIERVWRRWADLHSINVCELFDALHGVRLSDIVRKYAPLGVDIHKEIERLMAEERNEVDGISAVAGAAHFLDSLPASSLAVVTSADRALANIRLHLARLPIPDTLIAAEDVSAGKPDPEGYLRAAKSLNCRSQNILVFEDSTAGLDAGRTAGFRVIGVSATRGEAFHENEAWIEDFTSISVENIRYDGGLALHVIR